MIPPRYFVTGTGTDVGKTLVAAVLVQALGADYWKPVQTGLEELPQGDTGTIARLTRAGAERLHPPLFTFSAPLSPDQAAAREQSVLALSAFPTAQALPAAGRPLIVEGAGGLLVPLNPQHTMADLMARFALPVIVVARSGLGTINHTLLTLEALRARALPLAGVIFSGSPHPENVRAVRHFGKVRVFGTIPLLAPVTPEAVTGASRFLDLDALRTPDAQ